MTWLQAPISIREYFSLSVREMASKFSARAALAKKNTRQHRRSLGQGEGCVCANAGEAGRGCVKL